MWLTGTQIAVVVQASFAMAFTGKKHDCDQENDDFIGDGWPAGCSGRGFAVGFHDFLHFWCVIKHQTGVCSREYPVGARAQDGSDAACRPRAKVGMTVTAAVLNMRC